MTTTALKYALLFLIGCLALSSCELNEDEKLPDPEYSAPVLDGIPEDIGNFGINQIVRVSLSIEGRRAIESIVVNVEDTIVEEVIFDDASGLIDYDFVFRVPESWLNTTRTFEFVATDVDGRKDSGTYSIAVSEITPNYNLEEVNINGESFTQITGTINFDEVLFKTNKYIFYGEVQVDQGTTLTIEPGTTIYARNNETDPLNIGFAELNVLEDATLIAEATVEEPIIFTSFNNAPGQSGNPERGDWKSITLRGNGQGDSSGILKYVRVEYSGGDDANGIELRNVGSATEINYVSIHNNGGSGVRLRGGAVNLKHIIITDPSSRGLRYSGGWSGNVQYLAIATASSSRAINGADPNDMGIPIISNATIVGAGITINQNEVGEGVRIQDLSSLRLLNTVVTGFDDSYRQRDDGDLILTNSVAFGNGPNGDEANPHSSMTFEFLDPVNANSDQQFSIENLRGTSITNSIDPSSLSSFFDAANFVGAIQQENDWSSGGWARNFDGTIRE